jgi:hypothetical protein
MMNQIFRITFVTFIYKRYKQTILSSGLLLLVLWLIEKIHQDFVSYSQLNQDTSYLALSFGLKWLAFFCVTGLYTAWNLVFKKERFKKEKLSKEELKKYGKMLNEEDQLQDDLLAKMQSLPLKKAKNNTKKQSAQQDDEQAIKDKANEKRQPDPFDHIRNKQSLNSKADFVLKNKAK